MTLILILTFFCYFILVIGLIIGWQKAMRQTTATHRLHEIMISVVIPMRNEEEHIPLLIRDLKKQNFTDFEVILVNDHSNDNSNHVSRLEIENDQRFRIIQNFGQGKKMALTTGIKEAKGNIIVTTDGDCRVGKDWLACVGSFFYDNSTKLVFGGVRIDNNSLFTHCQAIEFGSLIGVGASTLMLGSPTMCNGANLAFRKETFEGVGGYEDNLHLPSGDDEFLLYKVFKKYPRGVRFINDARALVTTVPQFSWRNFIHQRIRWAGKWRYHTTYFSRFLAMIIFGFHLAFILTLILSALTLFPIKAALVLWTIKGVIELVFLRKISLFLRNSWHWLTFFVLQIGYSFYVVGIGLISNFIAFEWKGRKLKSIQINPISDQ